MSFTQVIAAIIGPAGLGVRQGVLMHSGTYRLEAEGELNDQIRPVFEGMTVTRDHGNTVFVGRVRDQGELFGLLQRFADLGLTLISVSELDHDAEH
jgi:hypothetical protein